MAAELTDLDGIGPKRSESLEAAGYPDVESLADADHETLAEEADLTEDKAIDFVVQAENAVAEEEAKVEEQEAEPVTEEIEDAVSDEEDDDEEEDESDEEEEVEEESSEDDDEEEAVEEEVESYSFTLEPETGLQYDVLFAAVMRGKETMLQANRTNTSLFDDLLDQMRSADVGDTLELEADADGLNTLHNHVRKLVVEYQGKNLIDHMNAMKSVQAQLNEVREKHLF